MSFSDILRFDGEHEDERDDEMDELEAECSHGMECLCFDRGQVVQLRSGGPRMTVVSYLSPDLVLCQWCVQKPYGPEYQHGTFLEATLEDAEDDDGEAFKEGEGAGEDEV